MDKASPSIHNLPVSYLNNEIPEFGVPTEVATGIWWIRLPISLAMNHVNVYLLEDQDGWVLVDTGCDTEECKAVLTSALASVQFAFRPITRVIVTHFHPDHVGLAGYFTNGLESSLQPTAKLLTSRTSWHATRLLHIDNPSVPHESHISFMIKAGMTGMELESFKRRRPSKYSDRVAELPNSYQRLRDFDKIQIGERSWQVRTGHGHADEQVTLWSDDNIAIVADQILPAISPNLSVHFSEPQANCVSDWLQSCNEFAQIGDSSTMCLPGHNRPFIGAPARCQQLIENCNQLLDRIENSLAKPKSALEILPLVYRRKLSPYERNLLIGEVIAYLNCLHASGRVSKRVSSNGAILWQTNASHRVQKTLPKDRK